MENEIQKKRGYMAEACRICNCSRTVLERARIKIKRNDPSLTRKELEVWTIYINLIDDAINNLKKIIHEPTKSNSSN